jgi:hypothetical protein
LNEPVNSSLTEPPHGPTHEYGHPSAALPVLREQYAVCADARLRGAFRAANVRMPRLPRHPHCPAGRGSFQNERGRRQRVIRPRSAASLAAGQRGARTRLTRSDLKPPNVLLSNGTWAERCCGRSTMRVTASSRIMNVSANIGVPSVTALSACQFGCDGNHWSVFSDEFRVRHAGVAFHW